MLVVDFINVGYGDAILLREIRHGRCVYSMLVDCGDLAIPIPPGSQRNSAAQFLRREGLAELDLLVLTHLHLDHVGGLEELLDGIGIRELWCNHLPPRYLWGRQLQGWQAMPAPVQNLCVAYDLFSRCLVRLEATGTAARVLDRPLPPQSLGPGKLRVELFCPAPALYREQNLVWMEALHTGVSLEALEELDGFINDTSLRLRLYYGQHIIELPGDLGTAYWSKGNPGGCTLLKLPHHGHRDCITDALAHSLSPAYAVICVSNDREDDCPSGEVLDLLSRHAGRLLFTDDPPRQRGGESAHSAVRFVLGEETLDCELHCYNQLKKTR